MKTRVYKVGPLWFVEYTLPYSGNLIASFLTWQDAMDDACALEKYRVWA